MPAVKPVASDKLKRMARATGALLEIRSPAMDKEAPPPAPEPSPPPVPEPGPPSVLMVDPQLADKFAQAADGISAMGRQLIEQGKTGDRLVDAVRSSLANLPVQEKRPGRWLFKVNRDTRGLIESIEAVAKGQA
jgi:hypothetical protein